MNESELQQLRQSTNEKIAQQVTISKKNLEFNQRLTVMHLLGSIKPIKLFALLTGVVWVGVGISLLVPIFLNGFAEANKFFLFSAMAQVVLTAVAVCLYIYQLTRIYQVEVWDPILETQERLAQLQISTLWVARILFLQLPVWTIFWWNDTMLSDWHPWQWSITLTFTAVAIYAALWLFVNISYTNRRKKWFKLIFHGKEWTPLEQSMRVLEEIDINKNE